MKAFALLVLVCFSTTATVSGAGVTTNMAAWLSSTPGDFSKVSEMEIPRFDGLSKAFTATHVVIHRDNAGRTNSRLSRAVYCPKEQFLWIGPEMEGSYLIVGNRIVFCTKRNALQFKCYGWGVVSTNPPKDVLTEGFQAYASSYFDQQRFYSVSLGTILGPSALSNDGLRYTPDGKYLIGWSGSSGASVHYEIVAVRFESTNIATTILSENGVKSTVTFRPDFKPIAATTNGTPMPQIPTNCVRILPQRTILPEWLY